MTGWFTNNVSSKTFLTKPQHLKCQCLVCLCMYKFIFVHMNVIIFVMKSFSVIFIHFCLSWKNYFKVMLQFEILFLESAAKNYLSVKIKLKNLILLWKLPWGLALFKTCHLYYLLRALLSGSPLSIWKLMGLFILFEL